MIRSFVSGLLGLLSVVAVGSLPTACQSGGVGDPCTPEDEFNPEFAGFKVTEENIESRSFQCQTRICLVNHFQGRVSCPLGQPAPDACSPGGTCANGGQCVLSAVFAPECESGDQCASGACNAERKFCECTSDDHCPQEDRNGQRLYTCVSGQCQAHVCYDPAQGCQRAGNAAADIDYNNGKACCVPGTDTPVAAPVCGQCRGADQPNTRSADQAVYCSCRCGPAEGQEEGDFNYCECPTGYTCAEIRPDVGLGDKQITGKYCIKEASEFVGEQQCDQVLGHYDSEQCKGIAQSL